MRKVVMISLNGNAYQVEEGGYEALRAYLDDAQQKLRDDPDSAEIIADLEQAIGEKCARLLDARKSVISTEELQQILAQMGPVEGGAGAGPNTGTSTGPGTGPGTGPSAFAGSTAAPAPRRLYQIREGAIISGLCNGIAAYLNIDVLIVRIIFVALAFVTGGGWILVYIALMFVIPFASTLEDRAAAHGLPFTAQRLVEVTKRYCAALKRDAEWRRYRHREARWHRREQRAQWRAHRRREREAWRAQRHWWWTTAPPPPPPAPAGTYTPPYTSAGYFAQLLAGVLAPLASLANAALLIVLLIAIVQVLDHGVVFGWATPVGLPAWAAVLVLLIIYSVVSMPLRAVRQAAYYARGGGVNLALALWGSALWLACIVLFIWLASHFWPQLQHFLRQLTDALGGSNGRGQAIDFRRG